jgi:glutamine amidotransferase
MKVVIVDYGMGNVRSLETTLNFLGINDVLLASDYETLKSAEKIILPGVGSYAAAMNEIKKRKIDIYLHEIVVEDNKPIIGICLGMQLLGKSSTEDGFNTGLGFIDGEVDNFDKKIVKVPHVGFNQVFVNNQFRLYKDFNNEFADFYFTHSFRMTTKIDINQCYCFYQDDFVASFEFKNIVGTQFHPELSQTNGLKLLRNFIENF